MDHSILSDSAKKRDPVNDHAAKVAASPQPFRLVAIEPIELFEAISITADSPASFQFVVTSTEPDNPGKRFNNNKSHKGDSWPLHADMNTRGRRAAGYVAAAFSDYYRRREYVTHRKVFSVDIEGSVAKGGYEGQTAALAALSEFVTATGLEPSFVVTTSSGGIHAHWVLERAIPVDEWQGLAVGLVELAAKHGLLIDTQCTTDAVRVFRAPGSIHQDTGGTVLVYRCRVAPYALSEWKALVPVAANKPPRLTRPSGQRTKANGDYQPYSYHQAAWECAAMREAALDGGRDAEYGVWLMALAAAKHSVEGEDFAHEISTGHKEYSEQATDAKMKTLIGGPPSCAAWEDAYGPDGPCKRCRWRGTITNPAAQLGRTVIVSLGGAR